VQVEGGEKRWQDRQAEALLVYHGIGPLVGFARSGDGRWYEAKIPMSGGKPEQPVGREPRLLTPQELLDALRGPLEAD